MSACNGFVTADAAYLFTDAVICDPTTFRAMAFLSKVCLAPQIGAAISATGNMMVGAAFGSALAENDISDFDDLVRSSPRLLRDYAEKYRAQGQGHVFEGFRITVAGWSPKTNAPALYCIQGDDNNLGGARSFEMFPSHASLNPAAAHENDRSIIDMPFDPVRPAQSGLDIMRAQRAKKFGPHYAIGGWCQMTIVTRDGISTKVLERWPDEIGKEISMADKKLMAGTFS